MYSTFCFLLSDLCPSLSLLFYFTCPLNSTALPHPHLPTYLHLHSHKLNCTPSRTHMRILRARTYIPTAPAGRCTSYTKCAAPPLLPPLLDDLVRKPTTTQRWQRPIPRCSRQPSIAAAIIHPANLLAALSSVLGHPQQLQPLRLESPVLAIMSLAFVLAKGLFYFHTRRHEVHTCQHKQLLTYSVAKSNRSQPFQPKSAALVQLPSPCTGLQQRLSSLLPSGCLPSATSTVCALPQLLSPEDVSTFQWASNCATSCVLAPMIEIITFCFNSSSGWQNHPAV